LTGNNTTLVDGIIFSAGTTIASSYSNGTYTLTGITFDQLNSIVMTLPEGMKGTFNVDVTAQTIENSNLNTGPIASSSFQMVINSKASGVTTFNASVGDQVNTTITGKTIVNKDHNIALILTDIDLVDKDGSESLTLILKGLTDSLTVDASALTGVTTQKQNDGSWLVELGNPLDGNYNTNLTALANGDIKLVSTSTSGSVDSIEVSAYSTLIQSNEKSSDSPLQNVALNLTVDTNGAIDGTANDDYLVGGAGSDFIDGGLGDDILVGGLGVDTLTGNTGNDKFRISANEDSTDVISDFTDGEDKLDLSEIIGIPAINSSNFNDYIQTSVSGSDLLVQIFENGDGQSSGTPTQSILLNNQSALSLDELDIHQD
jgi:Ca2+-binding RTX toxin-like protein